MYIYESHMGGYYASDTMCDDDSLYCEDCGDYDRYIGEASSKKAIRNLLGNGRDVTEFINRVFTKPAEQPVKMNRYEIVPEATEEDVIAFISCEGGSWINKSSRYFKTVCLADPVELNVGFNTVDDWDDFEYVLILDDDFGQPYTPFYGDNYGKEISDFEFLQKVIRRYNEEMDKIPFLRRRAIDAIKS